MANCAALEQPEQVAGGEADVAVVTDPRTDEFRRVVELSIGLKARVVSEDFKESGLREVQGILDGVDDIAFCQLTNQDVVRHRLVGRIVAAYDRYDAVPPQRGQSARQQGRRVARHAGQRRANESGETA